MVNAYYPSIVKGLREKVLNSDVACEARFKMCKANHFEEQNFEAYKQRVMADKPDFLKNDDFID